MQTITPCIDRFLDQHRAWSQLPWKSTHYSEGAPRKFSVTDAEDLVIMLRTVPQDGGQASDLGQRAVKDVAVAKGVTP